MAAPTRNNQQNTRSTTNASSYTLASYTPTTGSNRVLAVRVAAMRQLETDFTISVTFGGVSMTEAATYTVGWTSRWLRTSIFYLINPSSSAGDIVVTTSAAVGGCIIDAVTLLGAAQTSLIGATDGDSAVSSVTQTTVALTGCAADSLILAIVASNSGGPPTWSWATATEDFDLAGTNDTAEIAAAGAYYATTASGDVSITSTRSSTTAALSTVGVEFKAAESSTEGTLSKTQAGNTLSATGTVSVSGTLSKTQAADTLTTTGTVAVVGTLAKTQTNNTLSSTGTAPVSGTLAQTQAANSISATGVAAIAGTLSVTQGADALSATATAQIGGTLGASQAGDTLSATGAVKIVGTLSATQVGDTLSATASTPIISSSHPQATRSETEGTSYTLSYTVPDVANRVLAVRVHAQRLTQADFTLSVDYGGTALTLGAEGSQNTTVRWWKSAVFYLLAPTVGTATITVTSDQTITGIVIQAETLSGVRQTSPIGSTATGAVNATQIDLSLTGLTSLSHVLAAVTSNSGGPPTWDWSTAIESYEQAGTTNNAEVAGTGAYYQSSGGSATLSAVRSVSHYQAGVAVEFLPALNISGTLAATQAGNTLSATGTVAVVGTAGTTQAGDTLSATATVSVSGTLGSTQAGDSLASTGTLAIAGQLAQTQAGDTLEATGVGGANPISGTLSVTQAGNSITATATVEVAGVLGATQEGDALTSAGVVSSADIIGTVEATQAGDGLVATATISISGVLAQTQGGDSLAAGATVAVAGTAYILQVGNILVATAAVDLHAVYYVGSIIGPGNSGAVYSPARRGTIQTLGDLEQGD